jgi:DNA topoisomerase-1
VHLLDTTLERVGNDEYARNNGSYGLTTLRCRHASIRSGELRLCFRGKSGVAREVSLHDRRIARIVRRCQALPGQELFQYIDTQGSTHRIDSTDVNDYLREVAGDFTAKDFRTWHGSVQALQCWRELDPDEAAKPTPALAKRVLAEVAERLGNTVAVCRKAYVHPRVLALLTDAESARRVLSTSAAPPKRRNGWSAAEVDFLRLLGRCG